MKFQPRHILTANENTRIRFPLSTYPLLISFMGLPSLCMGEEL